MSLVVLGQHSESEVETVTVVDQVSDLLNDVFSLGVSQQQFQVSVEVLHSLIEDNGSLQHFDVDFEFLFGLQTQVLLFVSGVGLDPLELLVHLSLTHNDVFEISLQSVDSRL